MVSKFFHERILDEYADGKGVNDTEGMKLAYLADKVPSNGVIVEIGSYRGQSAAYLAGGSKQDVKIYLVDLWDREHLELVSEENQYAVAGINHLTALKKHMQALGLLHRFTFLRGLSIDYAHQWKIICNKKIDLLFIDGDHSYEGVKSDYENWYPHVKRGGVIAFHDYSEHWSGVMNFIDNTVSNELDFYEKLERLWIGNK